MVWFCAKVRSSATSGRPPWPAAKTFGRPASAGESLPSAATIRMRPGRSVTSMRPSGRKATAQGWSRPFATVWTAKSPPAEWNTCACAGGTPSAMNPAALAIAHRRMRNLIMRYLPRPIRHARCSARRGDNDAVPPMFRQGLDGSLRCDRNTHFSSRRAPWHVWIRQERARASMRMTSVVAALAIAVGCVTVAHAQGYPSRPITIIVPFPAGGPSDTLARILGERMRVSLGQPILVEPVTGAGASIGVARAAQAAPDGYTLSIGNWTSHVGAGAMYPAVHDLLLEVQPVSRISATPLMIVGKNDLPPKDARALIDWLKANPGKASAATVGAG